MYIPPFLYLYKIIILSLHNSQSFTAVKCTFCDHGNSFEITAKYLTTSSYFFYKD